MTDLFSKILLAFGLSIALGTMAAAHASTTDCPPVDEISRMHDARIVVFGEYHGTVEIPEFFQDVVCNTAVSFPQEKLLIALEMPDAFNTYFERNKSGNGTEAVESLKKDDFWNGMRDGRHSASMLGLVVNLMSMARSGPGNIELVAVKNSKIDSAGALFLSDRIQTSQPDRTLVLIGNAHAMKNRVADSAGPSMAKLGKSFADNLAERHKGVVSLDIMAASGKFWGCWQTTCEPRSFRTTDLGLERRIVFGYASESGRRDGVFYLPHLSVSLEVRAHSLPPP